MRHLGIGDVAHRAGVNPSAIRYYERIGLLPEPARVNGRRRYDAGILKRLALVRMTREARLTIEEIGTLVGGFPEATPPGERWREVDALIQRMMIVRQVLEESLQCDCLTPAATTAGRLTRQRRRVSWETRTEIESEITCSICGTQRTEHMPEDSCQILYQCTACGAILRPKPGDCCVFCSYGSVPCPPIQSGASRIDEPETIPRTAPRRARAAPEPRAPGRRRC